MHNFGDDLTAWAMQNTHSAGTGYKFMSQSIRTSYRDENESRVQFAIKKLFESDVVAKIL